MQHHLQQQSNTTAVFRETQPYPRQMSPNREQNGGRERGEHISDSLQCARNNLRDLDIGDISNVSVFQSNLNQFRANQANSNQFNGVLHKAGIEGGMDIESKHFSMISPLPGNTPPPDVNDGNNADLRRIEAFLKANNALGSKSGLGALDLQRQVPMPMSQGASSRCNISNNIQSSSGMQILSAEDDQQTTQKQLNTFIQHSKVGTLPTSSHLQSQIDSLQTSVSLLIDKLESITKFTMNNFDTQATKIQELEQELLNVRKKKQAEGPPTIMTQPPSTILSRKSLDTSFINTESNASLLQKGTFSSKKPSTRALSRNRSRTGTISHFTSQQTLTKNVQEILNKQISELQKQQLTKTDVKNMIDKLGEEIAYDINQIENKLKDQQTTISEIQIPHKQSTRNEKVIANDSPDIYHQVHSQVEKYLKMQTQKEQSSLANSDDKIKKIIRQSLSDVKYQNKKLKEDVSRIASKYDNIKQKVKDQTRLVDKIRNNSHRNKATRSASKHREAEYLSKNKFGSFLGQLKFSMDLIITMLEDGHKRENRMLHNLLETQKHPTGKYVTVKPEVHDYLKRMIYELEMKGFNRPNLNYLIYHDENLNQFAERADPRFNAGQVDNFFKPINYRVREVNTQESRGSSQKGGFRDSRSTNHSKGKSGKSQRSLKTQHNTISTMKDFGQQHYQVQPIDINSQFMTADNPSVSNYDNHLQHSYKNIDIQINSFKNQRISTEQEQDGDHYTQFNKHQNSNQDIGSLQNSSSIKQSTDPSYSKQRSEQCLRKGTSSHNGKPDGILKTQGQRDLDNYMEKSRASLRSRKSKARSNRSKKSNKSNLSDQRHRSRSKSQGGLYRSRSTKRKHDRNQVIKTVYSTAYQIDRSRAKNQLHKSYENSSGSKENLGRTRSMKSKSSRSKTRKNSSKDKWKFQNEVNMWDDKQNNNNNQGSLLTPKGNAVEQEEME